MDWREAEWSCVIVPAMVATVVTYDAVQRRGAGGMSSNSKARGSLRDQEASLQEASGPHASLNEWGAKVREVERRNDNLSSKTPPLGVLNGLLD